MSEDCPHSPFHQFLFRSELTVGHVLVVSPLVHDLECPTSELIHGIVAGLAIDVRVVLDTRAEVELVAHDLVGRVDDHGASGEVVGFVVVRVLIGVVEVVVLVGVAEVAVLVVVVAVVVVGAEVDPVASDRAVAGHQHEGGDEVDEEERDLLSSVHDATFLLPYLKGK